MHAIRHVVAQLLLRAAIMVAPPDTAEQLAATRRPIWRPGAP